MHDETEIWTAEQLAEFLKMSVSGVYSLTRTRGKARADIPLPTLKIHSKALRFKKSAVLDWIDQIAAQQGVSR